MLDKVLRPESTEETELNPDTRRTAPSAARNRDPILAVLRRVLPAEGLVLEIASGTGEHVIHFAAALPHLTFQPSDPDENARASINGWVEASSLTNVHPALALDAASASWPIARADAIVCINMIHISPWASTLGLMRGAVRVLPPGGMLYLYGPYRRGGKLTAESNAAFDADLKARDHTWGIRDLDEVAQVALSEGFTAPEIESMPANNLSVMLRRS